MSHIRHYKSFFTMAFSVSADVAPAVQTFLAELSRRFDSELNSAFVEHYGPHIAETMKAGTEQFCDGCSNNKIYYHLSHSCIRGFGATFCDNVSAIMISIDAPLSDKLWADFITIIVKSDMPRDQAIRWIANAQNAEELASKVKNDLRVWLDKHHQIDHPLF
jgi:hypothetical protein